MTLVLVIPNRCGSYHSRKFTTEGGVAIAKDEDSGSTTQDKILKVDLRRYWMTSRRAVNHLFLFMSL